MKVTDIFSNAWRAIAHPPSPDKVRSKLLHQSQLDLIEAVSTAESLAAQAASYNIHADMLRTRIFNLRNYSHD